MGELHARLDGITDFGDYLIELIVSGRSMAAADPAMSRLLSSQDNHPFFDPGTMQRTREVSTEILAPILDVAPEYRPFLTDIVDLAALLSSSLLSTDDDWRTDDDLRDFLGRWLRPALRAMTDRSVAE